LVPIASLTPAGVTLDLSLQPLCFAKRYKLWHKWQTTTISGQSKLFIQKDLSKLVRKQT
jgi:hypothetical protein